MEPEPADASVQPYRVSQRYFSDKMLAHRAEGNVAKAAKARRRFRALRSGEAANIEREADIYHARQLHLAGEINENQLRLAQARLYAEAWAILAQKLTNREQVDRRAVEATLRHCAGMGFQRGQYLPSYLLQTYANDHDSLESFARWRLLAHAVMGTPFDQITDADSMQTDTNSRLRLKQIHAAALTRKDPRLFDLVANRQTWSQVLAAIEEAPTHQLIRKRWKCRNKERAILRQDPQAASALTQYYMNSIERRITQAEELRSRKDRAVVKEAAWRARLGSSIDHTERTDSEENDQPSQPTDDYW